MKRRSWPHPLSATSIAPAPARPGSERRSLLPPRSWITALAIIGLAALVLSL